ncbi:hypothetical protein EV356DRAFT_73100 [Viridothelium virens]|uniref:DUF676 domain-containing protein n=1 Tax=Viridothelium virens TaxID=1048519 RepID=A0A6A6HF58_VIRVR|nr:hypothetical protein EV356DRAFT_73100 [Viridothelium virens]
MRWEMGTKQYSTVYRVQGIPMEYRKKQLKEALTSIFHLLETENFVRIYSLAPNYTWSRSLKVATITFDKEIEVLSEGKKEACFVVPTGDTDDDDDDGAFSQRVTFKLDVHFEGLTPLRAFRNERDHLIDVVAVTGLGGHAYGSFKERGGDHMWLRDSLPQDLEAAQIYLYGYDSHLSNSQSFQGIVALATTLRQRLQRLRRVSEHDDRPVPRPLIFIAHSLGGILVKEALVQMQDDPHDQRMLKTVFGALFFGVPNHGMDITSLRTMVRGQPNENLVTQLGFSTFRTPA